MKSYLFLFLLAIQCRISLQCPDGWTTHEDTCYKLVAEAYTWFDAKRTCDLVNSHIVEIGSAGENSYLVDMMRDNNEAFIWLGLEDLFEEGKFVWLSTQQELGPGNYSNWSPGEPNDLYRGGEDCVMMKADGTWVDYPCEEGHFHFVCETSPTRR